MNKLWLVALRTFAVLIFILFATFTSLAQTSTPTPSGQHDFDFNFGTWKTHLKRLKNPLTGSTTWTEGDGTVVVRKVWDGRANLEEISMGTLEGLTLRLYNPEARQWNLYWSNSSNGTLNQSMIGEFKNGVGEFYDQELLNGRSILARQVFSQITKNSYHFEQAFSADGGRSWEANWIADLTRQREEAEPPKISDSETRQHDFDFHFGTWKTHVSRLQTPLTGSTKWVEYSGTSTVRPVWNGKASLFELEIEGPAGHIEGMGLRLYNPETRQWNLNWTNSTLGTMTVPMVGAFSNNRGDFYDQEFLNGKAIFARNAFSDIASDSSLFEQAFSIDGGKTWKKNWVMTFKR
jgi:hypothetical protein